VEIKLVINCWINIIFPSSGSSYSLTLSSNHLIFPTHLRKVTINKMNITNVTEYEAIAKGKLSKMFYDYFASGAEDKWTLKENKNAFSRIL